MVPQGRLERPTSGLGNRCSIHLSYWGMKLIINAVMLTIGVKSALFFETPRFYLRVILRPIAP
jgi:hypothetical protein